MTHLEVFYLEILFEEAERIVET